jgi:hypothetical protein
MTDVQTLGAPGARETEESSDGLEFADPAYSHSELVPDMLSKRAHDMLDKKALGRYPWIDDEKADDSIYPRITLTLLRSLARDYDQLKSSFFISYSYSFITRFFHEHPGLISVMNECWRKGSFRTVRLLSEYTGIRNWPSD